MNYMTVRIHQRQDTQSNVPTALVNEVLPAAYRLACSGAATAHVSYFPGPLLYCISQDIAQISVREPLELASVFSP